MTHPLSIADLPVYIWLRSHVYRSYPHIVLLTMQTRTKGLAPSPTRSLSKYGGISARVAPTYNLTNLYNYSQRSAYVGFPCNGSAFRRSLRCTSDTYSLHMHRMPTIKNGHAEAGKACIQICLFNGHKTIQ